MRFFKLSIGIQLNFFDQNKELQSKSIFLRRAEAKTSHVHRRFRTTSFEKLRSLQTKTRRSLYERKAARPF